MHQQLFIDLNNYNQRVKSAEDRRALAVAAALTVIHATASNPSADRANVAEEMNNLIKYADQIQAALKIS